MKIPKRLSSQIEKDASLKAQDRNYNCKGEKADIYINHVVEEKVSISIVLFEENRLQLYFLDVKQNEIMPKLEEFQVIYQLWMC